MPYRRLLIPLLAALMLCAPLAVAAPGGDPAASAVAKKKKKKKKKCKKALWKCAPKRYRLQARGVVAFPTGSQFWKAEIRMRRYRSNVGRVEYAQDGGTLTLRAGWTGQGPTSSLPTCDGAVRYDVPEQTRRLPKGDAFRFNAYLTFHLIGGKKHKYDFIVADAYELAQVTGTETCLTDSSRAQFPYWMKESRRITVLARGKPDGRRLSGRAAARGDTIKWKITRK